MEKSALSSLKNSTTVRSLQTAASAWWLAALARLSPDQAARSALRLFGTPPPPRPVSRGASPVMGRARELTFRAPAPRSHVQSARKESFTLDVEDAEVRAYVWGTGPSVYLVHGWGGRASQLTSLVDPLVARGLRVVAFDAPAHGASGGSETTLFGFAATLRALVALDTAAPFAFVGHSLGAASAIFAASEGMAPERLVLLAPPSDPARYVGHFLERLGATPAVEQAVRGALVHRHSLDGSSLTLADQARRVDASVLVVHDHDDTEIPWRHGAALARAWPGARIVSTRGLGHHRLLRDATVVESVERFLAARATSDAPPVGDSPPDDIAGICSYRSCTRPSVDDDLCLEHLVAYESAHPHTRWRLDHAA